MEWRTLNWLSDYEISELGEIRRLTKARTRIAGHKLKGTINAGYIKYKLVLHGGTKRTFLASRLVCEAFHGKAPSNKHQAAHWDGNSLNNDFHNLRWALPVENIADKERHGRVSRGTRNGRAKLTDRQIKIIRKLYSGRYGEVSSLAKWFGLSTSAMDAICKRRHWVHVG